MTREIIWSLLRLRVLCVQAALEKEGCGAHFFKFQFNFWWIVVPAWVVVVCWRRIAAALPN
jgi:hypothetical protein